MLAVIDETTPLVAGGICYVLASAIVLSDENEARSILRNVIPEGRRRPFHWYQEGIVAKTAMESAIAKIGVVARAVVVPCGPRRQEDARAVAMEEILLHLLHDGCDRMLIESRARAQDGRDREAILDVLRRLGAAGSFSYSWGNKSEPLLWLADALSGTVQDHLTGADDDRRYDRLVKETCLTVGYRRLPPRW